MRNLQIVHQFPPERITGIELYTLTLTGDLIHRGHQVAVLGHAPAPELAYQIPSCSVDQRQNRCRVTARRNLDQTRGNRVPMLRKRLG